MRRSILAVLVLAAVAMPPAGAVSGSPAVADAIGVRAVVTGLDYPAAFTFAPDGRIFYGELNTGEIRIFNPAQNSDNLLFTVPNLAADGEQGLLGLELHWDYPNQPYVYAYVVRRINGTLKNQIVRVTNSSGEGRNMTVIFSSDTAPGTYHDGGRILFGPDRRLYAVIGESHQPAIAQDLSREGGKILRMVANGDVPTDNPFPGSRVFAYGIRNSYGFAFDPQTGRLWETENGPSCNDELNLIVPGGNYAWGPSQDCSDSPAPQNTNRDGPNRRMPLRWYTPTIAPTGAVFCSSCSLANSGGTLFFGAVNTGQIRRVVLGPERMGVASQSVVKTHGRGILSMERHPGGRIYFSDSIGIYKLVQN